MSVGLSGNLSDFGIAEVFQLIGQQRKTGVLELKGPTGRAQLVFDRGAVVSASPVGGRASDPDPLADRLVRCGLLTRARADEATAECRASARTLGGTVIDHGWLAPAEIEKVVGLHTRDTIFEVLRWHSGSFDFVAGDVSHDRPATALLGAEHVLMDGLRMVDEWQSFQPLVPSQDTVFQRVGRFDAFVRESDNLSGEQRKQAERMFQLVDGRLTARRIIDLSLIGAFDGTRLLALLHRGEVIRPLRAEGIRRTPARPKPGATAELVRSVLASCLPLALLGIAAFAAQGTLIAEAASDLSPAFEISPRGIESAREAYRTRRIRNALEAFQLVEGRSPEYLDELDTAGLVTSHELAPPPGRAYYSLERDGGVLLLAPER